MLAHEAFGGEIIGMRNTLEFHFAAKVLDVLRAALADAKSGDYYLVELLILVRRNRRANNQREQQRRDGRHDHRRQETKLA